MRSKLLWVIIGITLCSIILAIAILFFMPKKAKEITITFDTGIGTTIPSITIKSGESTILPSFTKEGYIFEGWYNGSIKVNNDTIFTENTTLKAKWLNIDKSHMTISFNVDGGKSIPNMKIECDTKLDLPTPEKDGYKFVNWLDINEVVISNETKLVCEDIELFAKWEKIEDKKKEYTCPEGYTLEGTKCKIEVSASDGCPVGSKADGEICLQVTGYDTDPNNRGVINCNGALVEIDKVGGMEPTFGEYYEENGGNCAYHEWTEFTTVDSCNEANLTDDYITVWANNKCYAKVIPNNYTITCISGYKLYNSTELLTIFGIQSRSSCLKIVDKEKICPDTYTKTDNKCIKTIDATEK